MYIARCMFENAYGFSKTADIITEHVCCKIVDEFYTEDGDE